MKMITLFVAIILLFPACAATPPNPWNELKPQLSAAEQTCKARFANTAALDPIRSKVQFLVSPPDASPPFAMLSDNTFPTDAERDAIQVWGSIRDSCIAERERILGQPVRMNAYQSVVMHEQVAVSRKQAGAFNGLLLALYQQKLTYGEFTQKRFELGQSAAAALREIDRSTVTHDEQLRAQAQQQFAQNLQAWASYMQAVNARAPQTVYLTGSVQVTH